MNELLAKSARALEDAFFLQEDQRLIQRLRDMNRLEETGNILSEVSGIADKQVVIKLAQLGVTPAVAASLTIFPLVEMAWADGTVHEKEKNAVLNSLEKAAFARTIDRDLVEAWLERKPTKDLTEAWAHYVQGLKTQLSEQELAHLKNEILEHTKIVAQAVGGVLGLGSISRPEKAVLESIQKAFE